MTNSIDQPAIIRTTNLLLVLLLSSLSSSFAQFNTVANKSTFSKTYSFVKSDGIPLVNPQWTVTGAGGTIVGTPTFTAPYTASASVKWTQGGIGTLTLSDGAATIATWQVVVLLSECVDAVSMTLPQGSLTAKYIPGQPAVLNLTPPSGSVVLWSPNSSFTPISDIRHGNSYVTSALSATTTFYAKSYNPTYGCYSTSAVQVQVTAAQVPNSVKQEIVRVEGITPDQLSTLTTSQKTTAITYVDGLGRASQSVAVQASPANKDIVAPVEYDANGRVSKKYLPYTITPETNGMFRLHGAYEQGQFYQAHSDKITNDAMPYAVSKFEDSPLGRLIEQGNIGQDMQPGSGHTQQVQYSFNDASEVRMFNADGSSTQFYSVNTLSKVTGIDADGNRQIVFTDKGGRTILKKQQLDEMIGGTTVDYLETYYVYDDMGRVKYIISPKGVAALKSGSWSFTTNILDYYTYQFVYDKRGRVIEKKSPGQAWCYIGYDNLNRMVLVQDGLLRSQNKWLFIKYDRWNRLVMQGLYLNTSQTTRAAVQSILDALYTSSNATYPASAYYETRGTSLHGYTNTSFPKTNADNSALELLAVNYYDNYDFDNNGTDDYAYTTTGLTGEHAQDRAWLLPTGSKRIVLGTSTWLYTYAFYDKYRRPIQVRTNNHLSTTIDNLVTYVYDFEGKLLTTRNYHNAGSGKVTTVINKYTYDNQGRLLKVYQNNDAAATDQLVAQYEYNELGQLVDKKLHDTGSATFLQSVDYRYTIRGQLASINNASLTSDVLTNDESTDYFGMELLYNTVETGLGNTALYNGNISAVKWKGLGDGSNTTGQKSYAYQYDKGNRLENGVYKVRGTGTTWDKEANALNESLTYDHNGNIQTLLRNQRKHQVSGVTVSFISEAIDNLTYTYNTTNGNSLEKVTDAALTKGFDNGTSGTANDYTYDVNGNLTQDKNKGINTNIVYNVLGKPTQITFADGRVINYTYDAAGTKLKMSVTQSSTTTTTDYVGAFVYENSTLSFFGSPEGRVVKNGSTLEYQYAIADNQGNTRVVFTSATPAAVAPLATFEGDANDQASQYLNVSNVVSFGSANHTTGGSKVVRMNQTYKTGPAKSVKVYPGDKIDMEVWEYHEGSSGFGASSTPLSTLITAVAGAFGGVSGGTGESGMIYNGVNSAVSAFGTGGNQGDSRPAAYLNFILMDKNYNVLDAGWQLAPATTFTKQKLSFPTKEIKEEGYIYVWLSYDDDSNNWVYFDDFKVTHTKSNIIQYNEYYPFGLQTASSWTRENTKDNRYLYNAANELNQTTGWYEMLYRGYDPVVGRMLQIDPYAALYSSYGPYNYGLNNPVAFNDASGGVVNVPYDYTIPYSVYYDIYGGGTRQAEGLVGGGGGGGGGGRGGGGEGEGGSGAVYFDEGGNLVIDMGNAGEYGGTWSSSEGWSYFSSDQEAANYAIDNGYYAYAGTERYARAKLQGVAGNASWVHFKYNIQWKTDKNGNNVSFKWSAQQGIPGMSIEWGRNFEMNNSGVDIRLSYKDPDKRFSDYGWIQTVRTNDLHNSEIRRGVRENEPFNDGRGDGASPYYGGPTDFDTEGFDTRMADSPGRLSNSSYVIWRAEVTIGGIQDGVFVPLGTLTYGFDIIDGKLNVYYPRVAEPTPWHVDSFTNKSKW